MMESARRGGQRVGVAMELEKEKWSERRESLAPPSNGMHRGEAEEGIKYKKPVSTDSDLNDPRPNCLRPRDRF